METTQKKEEKTIVNSDLEKKREVISFQVSPSEKRQITYKAIQECGCTVSEFIRTKIFMEPKPVEPPENSLSNDFSDEERSIYENKLTELSNENKTLKDELVKERIQKSNLPLGTDQNKIELSIKEGSVVMELEPEFKALIDRIKVFRDEKALTLDEEDKSKFYDFNSFLKLMFLRGIKRSYFSSDLKNSTGLQLSDFDPIVENSGISSWDI